MDNDKIREEIIFRAEKTLYYSELVIQQCDSWTSAEESSRKMVKAYNEKKKATKIARINRILSKVGKIPDIMNRLLAKINDQ